MQRFSREDEILFLVSDIQHRKFNQENGIDHDDYFQVVNYNHMMPTRYSVDISFDKTNINKELLKVRYSSLICQV